MSKLNSETQMELKKEAKCLQQQCLNVCDEIQMNGLEKNIPDNPSVQTLHYLEGVLTEIKKSSADVPEDENLLTSQFLSEMIDKRKELEELTAYTKGVIHDVDSEIDRLNTLINVAREAHAAPCIPKLDAQVQHVHRAKERFQLLKQELKGIIQAMFPGSANVMFDILGQLMQEMMSDSSDGYIHITSENYEIIQMLKDINVVCSHPYNRNEVKLAY